MKVDGAFVSTFLIVAFSLISWLFTQAQARTKSQRAELRHRRKFDLEKNLYIFGLEKSLTSNGILPPSKTKEFMDAEEEDKEW